MIPAKWDRRIRRANELASTYAFAVQGLNFYSRVATFQKSFYAEIDKALGASPKSSAERPCATNWTFSCSFRTSRLFYP